VVKKQKLGSIFYIEAASYRLLLRTITPYVVKPLHIGINKSYEGEIKMKRYNTDLLEMIKNKNINECTCRYILY